jgi:small subunit ribosomal protein S7
MSRKKKTSNYAKGNVHLKDLSGIMINTLLKKGKKSLARTIYYRALSQIEEETSKDGYRVLEQAVLHLTPLVEVKSRRMGGTVYQVPRHVASRRAIALAIRWLVFAARSKPSKEMESKLAREIIDASQRRGEAIKKREEIHRIAENNKAFAHLKV